jgi:hypothetical protein
MRGFKGGHRIFLREVARVLRQQSDEPKAYRLTDEGRFWRCGKPLTRLAES